MNNIKIKPITDKEKYTIKPPKGISHKQKKTIYENLFPGHQVMRILIVAKSYSGKTTLLSSLMNHLISNKSNLLFISSTLNDDITTQKILEKYSDIIPVYTWETINKSTLAELNETMKDIKKETSGIVPPVQQFNPFNPSGSETKIVQKPKITHELWYPQSMIVFDDVPKNILRSNTENNSLYDIIKRARHYGIICVSCHNISDLHPSSRNQMNVIFIGRLPEKQLEIIHAEYCTWVDYKTFIDVHKLATKEDHSFLCILTKPQQFRKNLNEIIDVDNQ